MENRIKMLRKSRRMNQEALAGFVGVSQQTISKIERNVSAISIDLLIQLADFFNVTTDYILGLSNEKRNLQCANKMNNRLEQYHNVVLEYERLNENNQKILLEILRALRQMQEQQGK